jgi:hypothetical protein
VSDPFTAGAAAKATRQRSLRAALTGRREPQRDEDGKFSKASFDGGARRPSPRRREPVVACRMAAHRRRRTPQPTPPELERMSYAVPPTSAEIALVGGIERAAAEDWRAAAWVLARRWPQRWAPVDRVPASSGPAGKDVEDEFGGWSPGRRVDG